MNRRREYQNYMSEIDGFTFNDLTYWLYAFNEFGIDARDLLPDPDVELPDQYSVEMLEEELEAELKADVEHQVFWWMQFDGAAEAVPLLESDGPESDEHPMQGRFTREAYDEIRKDNKKEAYINLVSSNVERKMGSLSGVTPSFTAEAIFKEDYETIRTVNHWAKDVKENTGMEKEYNRFKFDGVTIGSGVLKLGHGENWSSPDFGLFKSFLARRGNRITPEELDRFDHMFEYHNCKVIPSFHVIRYRGAFGSNGISLEDPSHRQLHWFENVSVAEAKLRWPEYADKISAKMSEEFKKVSPNLNLIENETHDEITVTYHRIKFPIIDRLDLKIGYPDDDDFELTTKEKPRFASGFITRLEGVGIVEMDLDKYNHYGWDVVQWVSYPSSKHSCGIGHVKFGRDPALVHNKLHNGMLEYFGRSMKGGGFYLDGVIDDEELREMSRGNRWVKISRSKLPLNIRNSAKISDIISDQRPPTFPSAWAQLMALEEQATDRSMKSTGAWKGERTGYSGVQQELASQDSGMMHINTAELLKFVSKEIGYKLYNNICQFDSGRQINFRRKNENGIMEDFVMNQPMNEYIAWDPVVGHTLAVDHIVNDIGSLWFRITMIPESIVPDKPIEKAAFYMNQMQYMQPWFKDPELRIVLENFAHNGMNIPGVLDALRELNERTKATNDLQAQLTERAEQYERLKEEREWAKNKAEIDQNLLRLMQNFVEGMAKANPETLKTIFSGTYPKFTSDFQAAMGQVSSGQPNTQQQLPTQQPIIQQPQT